MKILDLPAWSPALSDNAPLATSAWTTFKGTLQQIFDLFNSTGWNADFYKYSISRTVDGSGNMTISLLNYLGAVPSASAPVKIQIGWVVRTITSACQATFLLAWTNWWNTWSTELANKEVDWFVYILDYNNVWTSFNLWISRYPLYQNLSEATWWYTSEKYLMQSWNIWNETVTLIGRFNATLSAGAGYTWSIPATSVIINYPIYDTRWLEIAPTWTGFSAIPTNVFSSYRLQWNNCFYRPHAQTNWTSNATTLTITAPFWASDLWFTHWTWSFLAVDSGSFQTNPWCLYFSTANTYIEVYKNWAFWAWTNTGWKRIADWMIIYKI